MRRGGFHIFTDHRNLQYIFAPGGTVSSIAKPSADRLERWALLLRNFDYSIQHIPGDENHWGDLLSRWGNPGSNQHSEATEYLTAVTLRVGRDRVYDTARHVHGRTRDDDNDTTHDVEAWPSFDEIVRAQGMRKGQEMRQTTYNSSTAHGGKKGPYGCPM